MKNTVVSNLQHPCHREFNIFHLLPLY